MGLEKVCEDGMLLRFGGEQTIRPLRAIVYALLLGWCFMGVAIISDVFMVAIEQITSRKRRRFVEGKNRYVTETVWNTTVANLTLMALGSSAPEILINVLEIFRDDFFNGPRGSVPLGPSTIVGSAAFNLFVIIAVCVSVIPAGEVRRIKEYSVFVITAIFSVFAYLWLLVILLLITPHAVEVWEGVLTFLFFPLLVFIAWCVDKGFIFKAEEKRGTTCFAAEMTKGELAELETKIRKEHGQNLSEDQVAKFVQVYCCEQSSRAKYRIAATRAILGGKRVPLPSIMERKISGFARLVGTTLSTRKVQPFDGQGVVPLEPLNSMRSGKSSQGSSDDIDDPSCMVIEFCETKKAVLENAGSVTVVVVRAGGDLSLPCSVDYGTRDGTAHAPSDYVEARGTLEFGPNETSKSIQVSIVDDFSYEENEEFYIDLSNARMSQGQDQDVPGSVAMDVSPSIDIADLLLGPRCTATIVIVDDDLPGVLGFSEDELRVTEKVTDYEVHLPVQRSHGSVGKVTCAYRFEDSSAKAGTDYEASSGVLEFASQEIERTIPVKIKARGRYDQCEDFRVILEGPMTGGAKFDPESDGGPDCCILTVIIECEKVARDRVDRLMSKLQSRWDKAKVGPSDWRDQIVAALLVNGGDADDDDDDDEESSPAAIDYAMHVITVPWKLLFALCPPPTYCGGWLAFYVALGFIGFVTALISDLANLLGCTLDMCNAITAITFVALGTSLPDTFASKTAATQDPYADASIVNVTGSNSVNVFLGLGMPWMLGSIKWAISGRDAEWDERYALDEDIALDIRQGSGRFIVKAGDLGYSVGIFTAFAMVCLLILILRRRYFKGELGGPRIWKHLTAFVLIILWISYVALSSWKAAQGYC